MKQLKTEAVTLDTTDVFDADRSLLLFTREAGKLRARARGVRKPTSRLAGHLLPYVPTQLELIESGGWYLITQAQIASAFAQSAAYPSDPMLFSAQAAIVAELVNKLFVEESAHPELYDGLVYTFDRLRELANSPGHEQKAQLVVTEFLLKALGEVGYRPELAVCVLTSQPLESDFLAWSSRLGGLLSKTGYEAERADSFRLESAKTAVVLREFLKPAFIAERLGMDGEVAGDVCRVVYEYAQYQIGQPLKSLSGRR